jgi:hypothetical protein
MDSKSILEQVVWDSIYSIFDKIQNPKEGTPPLSLEACVNADEDTQEIMDGLYALASS